MDKRQNPWIPQTPIEPIAPIYPNRNQAVEGSFVRNGDMNGLDHLSSGDLLALANADKRQVVCGETLQKGDEAVASLSSESNSVAEQIKTPEKPKRKKYRPKVVKEAKPKREPKPKPPRKPAAQGQESKTPRRNYVRKKEEVDKDPEWTPVGESAAVQASARAKKVCRRALDFEDESFKPKNGENQFNSSDTKHADETESASRGNQKSQDCPIPLPSTPIRKRSQSKRIGKEPKNNGAHAAKRIQVNEPTCDIKQQKEMRSDAICRTSFAGQRLDAQEDVSTFGSSCYSFTSQASASRVLTMEEKRKGRQSFESNVPLDMIDNPIKKRPTGHAQLRNLSTPVTLSKKKRATKSEISQTNHIAVLPNPGRFPVSFAGLPPDEIWKQLHSVEAISEQLRVLDINRENSETALVPYAMNSTGNQIVLFTGGAGAIVPSTRVKKRRARAKVDLDNETDSVWKLLMENINSEGVDGSDEQKAKWWEDERNVFRGRAESFIARMHLVQDRHFSPWKGSIVDSVVGVFLTQNVSDHLSSSAFMSLAAEFPAPVVPSSNFDVGTSSMPSVRITYLDSEESMSNPPVHNHISGTLNITQHDEDKDYVNRNDTSRSSSEIAISAHESVGKTTVSKAHVDSDQKRSSVEVDKTDGTNLVQKPEMPESSSSVPSTKHKEGLVTETSIPDINESTSCIHLQEGTEKPPRHDSRQLRDSSIKEASKKAKGKKVQKEEKEEFDWDSLRREAQGRAGKRERTTRTMDTVDWEAIRTADVSKVAETIKSRGMNHMLAERIQGFLNRLVTKHESIDLEWLRDVPPDKVKEYLLSFNGLGLKSVECVRLLTLHHLAFPVDTNVGRIAVRLGWVPLKPLPESLQLHLLEMYPVLESIQKYLWPRLCKLDQKTLYELHEKT